MAGVFMREGRGRFETRRNIEERHMKVKERVEPCSQKPSNAGAIEAERREESSLKPLDFVTSRTRSYCSPKKRTLVPSVKQKQEYLYLGR